MSSFFAWVTLGLFTTSFGPTARTFTIEHGLPENYTIDVLPTPEGALWSATQGGFAQLVNGRFASVSLGNDVAAQFTSALELGSNGCVWVGTNAGVFSKCAQGQIQFDISQGLPSNLVTDLTRGSWKGQDTLFIATDEGVALLQGGRVNVLPDSPLAKHPRSVQHAIATWNDEVWLVTDKTLNHYSEQDGWAAVDLKRAGKPFAVFNAEERLLLGLETGLYTIEDDKLTNLSERWSLPKGQVNAIARHKDQLFLGSYDGRWVVTVQNQKVVRHIDLTALDLPNLMGIAYEPIDAEHGLIWLGTEVGCSRLFVGSFEHELGGPAWTYGHTDALSIDANDNVWLCTSKGCGYRTPTGEWHRSSLGSDFASESALAMAPYKEGMLAGTLKGRLLQLHTNGKRTELTLGQNADFNSILAVLPVAEDIWLGTRQGLLVLRDQKLEAIPEISILTKHITFDGHDLWVSTNAGVFRLDPKKRSVLQRYGVKEGLPSEQGLRLGVGVDAWGKRILYGSTWGGGLSVLDLDSAENVFRTVAVSGPEPIPDPHIYDQKMRDDKRLFLSTIRGLARLTPATDLAWNTYRVEHFTEQDGLSSSDMPDSEMWFSSTNTLYIGSARLGISRLVDADNYRSAVFPGKVQLRSAQRSGTDIDLAQLQTLTHRDTGLRFDFDAPVHHRDFETKYRTQLLDLESKPSEFSLDTKREFTALPPGDYRFEVEAQAYNGDSLGKAAHAFSVLPPPWKTWWAYLSYVGLIVASTVQATRWRIRSLQEAARALEAKVAARTMELSVAYSQLSKNAEEIKLRASELQEKNTELEETQRAANRIFNALAMAMQGTILDGKYLLAERIGEGGFGIVFRATREADAVDVAVKVFRPQAGNDSGDSLKRFQQEARSAMLIQHPNAIAIYDSGVSADGVAYMVMELLRGKSLQQELDEKYKLEARRALRICIDVCAALKQAHELNVIHRDIKPDNVFLCEGDGDHEIVKVLDFGIAKMTAPSKSMNLQSLTMTGAVLGTPAYLAPERLQGETYDARSDVYAVAIMLYQMLVGRVPFESESSNVFSIVLMHLNQAPPPMTNFDPTVDPALQALVLEGLEKNPLQRPTAAEYQARMAAYLDKLTPTAG